MLAVHVERKTHVAAGSVLRDVCDRGGTLKLRIGAGGWEIERRERGRRCSSSKPAVAQESVPTTHGRAWLDTLQFCFVTREHFDITC